MKTQLLSACLMCFFAVSLSRAADAPATQPAERTTPSGLKIVEVKSMTEAQTAQSGDLVWVHYTGKLANGTVFDSSFNRRDPQGEFEPISFRLGQGKVIKGWDEGIAGMKVGEKRTLTIPPDLAYGAQGTPDGSIPPNSTLTFDVELVGIYRESK
jgi:peptidylprolyl isomerase